MQFPCPPWMMDIRTALSFTARDIKVLPPPAAAFAFAVYLNFTSASRSEAVFSFKFAFYNAAAAALLAVWRVILTTPLNFAFFLFFHTHSPSLHLLFRWILNENKASPGLVNNRRVAFPCVKPLKNYENARSLIREHGSPRNLGVQQAKHTRASEAWRSIRGWPCVCWAWSELSPHGPPSPQKIIYRRRGMKNYEEVRSISESTFFSVAAGRQFIRNFSAAPIKSFYGELLLRARPRRPAPAAVDPINAPAVS